MYIDNRIMHQFSNCFKWNNFNFTSKLLCTVKPMCNVRKTVMIPKRESYLTGITQGNILTVIQSTATNWLYDNSNRGQIEVYYIYTRNILSLYEGANSTKKITKKVITCVSKKNKNKKSIWCFRFDWSR
jgi:hypothetical protein